MKELKLVKYIEDSPHWWVCNEQGSVVGMLEMYEDGFFYFEQNGAGGFTAANLREIASFIEEANNPTMSILKNILRKSSLIVAGQ